LSQNWGPVHYAAASLGAWAGGASNFQFFSHFAIQPQEKDKQINLAYAKRIGYDEATAKELDESGIVAIPASLALPLFQAQGGPSTAVLGGIPVNEFNAVNLPDSSSLGDVPIEGKDARFGFLMDSFYRALFTARTLRKNALFGASNVLRDHYSAFYKQFSGAELLRCKHYCVPIIEVGSFEVLKNIVAEIPIHDRIHGLFFRGQNKMYPLFGSKLGGEVEVDESFIGGKARNMHLSERKRRITGTGTKDKTAVMGILERGGKIRTTVVPSRKKRVLQDEVRKHVEVRHSTLTPCSRMKDSLPITHTKFSIMQCNT
jgi:ISXO2-like transposase domain